MSTLVYRYSTQNKHNLQCFFESLDTSKIYFDEVDFYCFIKFFNAKELITLFNKYSIHTIEFQNIDEIEFSIENIVSYYEYIQKNHKLFIVKNELQIQLKTLITLLRYVDISQKIVDRLSVFYLTNNFRDIYINDKIYFIDSQIIKRKKFSDTISKVVENKLLEYLDLNIKAAKEKKSFEIISTNSNIKYSTLVYYINPNNSDYISKGLSIRVSKILKYEISSLYLDVIKKYYPYITEYQKGKVKKFVRDYLIKKFDFDFFFFLVTNSYNTIDGIIINKLKDYLHERINNELEKTKKNDIFYSSKNQLLELILVGFWCFENKLKKEDFIEFLGVSLEFDFYFKNIDFDFSNFNVTWLLDLYPNALNTISQNNIFKNKIRESLAKELEKNEIDDKNANKLKEILIKYFC